MTRISVCIATYNGGRFIREQLVSILAQSLPADELIISDDSSTDDTLTQIRQVADSRILILTNPDQRSPVCNFENALRYATGDIIFLSDQDDIWFPSKIETMLVYLQDYDLVVSDCDFIDEAGKAFGKSFFETFHSGPGILKNFLKNTYLGNCMAFRRSVLKRALPFPKETHRATKYLIYQDVWLGLLANSLFRVMFIPEKLSGFRRHNNNASPTEMTLKSPQSLGRKLIGRMLLALGLLKQILNIA
ncbi:glycosyltransferase family 2 protein [Spirosoma endophyticum]|uniref:Glycosyltransferase involved in cell wall bisynthesis n=1 Tax=Spirosoma endophyticum TaxID=662367 RepID=A0A1I1T9T9_9BACT|nr:glycosyltransferase family 2 protein [Spirosoma endophyticum]SFD55391.1 Glycosyltransferase involved in cell wall bisynthesis [Spirosoma endophyticum]